MAQAGRAPRAALALLAGMGGKGKSTLAANDVAQATLGQIDGKYAGEPVNVLWVGNEDGREDVIGPRLRVAGADFSRAGHTENVRRSQRRGSWAQGGPGSSRGSATPAG